MKFSELEINEKILNGLKDMGFDEAMPIQKESIPVILKGSNIIGEADTGTGKTAAFVIPLLNNINLNSKKTEALIVTPTRELAIQIVEEIQKIGKYMRPSYATLVGGMSIRDQVRDLSKNPTIVVGTLGRINDHIRNRKLDLSHVKYFVLDEADEMLKEGFKDDIDAINAQIPDDKQTLLFSATISKPILALTKRIMDDYEFVSVKDKDSSSKNIEQYYITMKEKNKFSVLTKLLDIDNPRSAIIFGRTKRRVDELNEALNKCGYRSVGIHGDLSQQQRNAVMKKFKEGRINILVATDVAARGLDINDIEYVYNFDLPQEVEFYVHRVGRTGRAQKSGISYSFIKDSELAHIRRIEKEAKMVINPKEAPSFEEVSKVRNKQVINTINHKLDNIDSRHTNELAKELLNEFDAEALVSVLIESISKKVDINDVKLTGEPGVVVRRMPSNNRNRRDNFRDRNRSDRRSRENRNSDRKRSRNREYRERSKRK